MDNAIIVNESVNFEKTERVLTVKRILLKVLIVAMVFVAALCLFAVFGSGETLLGKIGSAVAPEFQTRTSAVAYAWNNPTDSDKKSNGGYTSCDYSSATAIVNNQNATLKTGTETSESWNYYSRTYSGSGMSYASGGISANQTSSYSASMLFYVDIYLDDAIRSAIAHGQISSCSVAMKVADSGGGYWRNVGHFYGTFFLCASATGTTSAELNDMGDSEWTGDTTKWASWKTFDNKVGGGRVDKTSGTLTITLDATMKKIRYGAYLRMTYDGSGTSAETFLHNPTATSAFNAGTYKNPSITVKNADPTYGSVTASSGYGKAFTLGTKYTAVYESTSATTTTTVVIGNIKAEANAGYYFSGWTITGGEIKYYKSDEDTSETSQDTALLTLDLPGGYALKGDVVVTAHFKKIEYKDFVTGVTFASGTKPAYTYKQQIDSNGNVVLDKNNKPVGFAQGPVVEDGSITGFKVKGGKLSNGVFSYQGSLETIYYTDKSDATGSWKATTCPSDSGTYYYTIGIFATDGSTEPLGYLQVTFTIARKGISSGAGGAFTIASTLPSRVYMGYAYKPTAEYIDIVEKSPTDSAHAKYRIMWSDFVTVKYGNNVNAGQANVQLTASGTSNFSGNITVYFDITKRSMDTVTVSSTMAKEIQERYSLYYNGYEQRPEVLQVRVEANVTNDEGKTVSKEFILYYGAGDGATYTNNYASKGYEERPKEGTSSYEIVNLTVSGSDGTINLKNAYSNNINITTDSKASFVITMTGGNFEGEKTVEFDIASLDLTNKQYHYDATKDGNKGKEIYSSYTVADQTGTLVYNGDKRNLDFGYVLVTVSGLEHQVYANASESYMTSSADITYYIRKDGITADPGSSVDSGSVYTITEYDKNTNVVRAEDGDTDVVVDAYGNRVKKSAIAKVTMASGNNIVGTLETRFAITPKDLKEAKAYFSSGISATYIGPDTPVEPYTQVKIKVNTLGSDYIIDQDRDYTVEFSQNINATRVAKVTISGIGNFTGTIENNQTYTVGSDKVNTGGQFIITAIDASNAVIAPIADQTYMLGQKIIPNPDTIELTVGGKTYTLTRGVDFGVASGTGTNEDVGEGYISVNFAGYSSTSDQKGGVNTSYGTLGNFYTSKIQKVTFKIVARDIGTIATNEEAEYFASWANDKDSVTYDGNRKTGLTIIANEKDKNNNTLYIKDGYKADREIVAKVLKFGKDGEDLSDKSVDYIISYKDSKGNDIDPYGENINAGIEAGSITVTGVNNYTGTLTIKFRIYAKNIEDLGESMVVAHTGSDTATASQGGYSFTGSRIMPEVTSVTYYKDSTGTVLANGTDYNVTYGGSATDKTQNYYVTSGGVINIVGTGNYTGTYVCKFSITKISQTIEFKDPKTDSENSALQDETIAKKGVYDGTNTKFYADYEIAVVSGTRIRLEATTTAIFPSARRITFRAENINGQNASVTVKYVSCTEVEEDGQKVSKTVAYLSFNDNAYGIVRIYAEQYDAEITSGLNSKKDGKVGDEDYYNYGNYESYKFNDGVDSLYAIYAKRVDKFGADSDATSAITKIYGNPDFTRTPNLESYKTDPTKFIYKCVSADEKVLAVNSVGSDVSFHIEGAGSTTITYYHDGFVNPNNDSVAYMAFSQDVSVTVNKRKLTISCEDLTVVYGMDPRTGLMNGQTGTPQSLFTYTYATSGAGDGRDGLSYQNKTDNPNDIITNLSTTYSGESNKNVGTYTLRPQTQTSTIQGDLFNNYDIDYGDFTLTVEKKQLSLTVANKGSVTNQLKRVYGTQNPSAYASGGADDYGYRFTYSGFAYGENDTVINTAPAIDYSGSVEGYDEVTVASSVGSYVVRVYGGSAANYTFIYPDVTLVITKAYVTITLENKIVDYTGSGQSANVPIITGVAEEGCSVPIGADDPKKITYTYYDGSQNELNGIPGAAGTYKVKITFTADASDNYQTTTFEKPSALTIAPVEPVITYGDRQYEYSEEPVALSNLKASISGISGGSTPQWQDAEVLFAKSGTAPDDCIATNTYRKYFSATLPQAKGKYDVVVIYEATTGDNYKDCIKRFNEVIEITTGLATIQLNSKTGVYNGNPLTIDRDKDLTLFFKDKTTGGETELDKSKAVISYKMGETYYDAPVNAGVYDVIVVYEPSADEEVSRTTMTFSGAITITKYDLFGDGKDTNIQLALGSDTTEGYRQYDYNGTGRTLKDREIQIAGTPDTSYAGSLSIKYVKDGNEYLAPINVGAYDVVVSYTSDGADNYMCSGTITFERILRINAVDVTITALSSSSSYDYTGKSVSFSAICSGVTVNGIVEEPLGTLSYAYCVAGHEASDNEWSTDAPVNAGTYSVRVTYKAVTNDNYSDGTSRVFEEVITINKVQPIIVISTKTFDFGDSAIGAVYTIKGAQFDTNGPMGEIKEGTSSDKVEYSARQTSETGTTYYTWSETKPSASGKYSVRITFTPGTGSNYEEVTATQYDCLIIANVKPDLIVEKKTVTYDGTRHKSNVATVQLNQIPYYPIAEAEDELYAYYGTVSYEYRKSGTNVWTSTAPQDAGVYDVRVKYNENISKDVFTSASVTLTGGLVIEKLVINVAPVYGQGKIYDGKSTTGNELAYAYSYKSSDGNIEYVYSTVTDNETGDRIDVSRATYVASNGEVYTVWTNTESKFIAWRDYIEVAVEYIAGEFTVDGNAVNVNYDAIGQNEGEAVIISDGLAYIIDLDNNFAYRRKADASYNVTGQSGYFFSVVDAYGRVKVISIDKNKLKDGKGTVNDTSGATTTSYSINLATLTASANGETFKIYTYALQVEYGLENGISVKYDVDPSCVYQTANANRVFYKTSAGRNFIIDLEEKVAQEAYEITVNNARFEYNGDVYEFSPADIVTGEYYANAYIGDITLGGHSAQVNILGKYARIRLMHSVEYNAEADNYNIEGAGITFASSELESEGISGLYKLDTGYAIYYIEFTDDGIIARASENKAEFDASINGIVRTEDGAQIVISNVDKTEFTYNRMHTVKINGKTVEVKADIIKLFDADYTVKAPALISGNSWSGSLTLDANNSGEYDVLIGTLTAGSNYEIQFFKGGIKYYIDKARITVNFIYGDENDDIYDGMEKFIGYELEGLIGNDTIIPTTSYIGDRREVSDEGYSLRLTIDSQNYELVGGESKKCFILPAQMEEIVFEPVSGIVYDGKKHTLSLIDVPTGATVTYDGSPIAPTFEMPGTYVVIAVVSKANYIDTEVELSLTISRAPFSITPNEVPGTLRYGDPLPNLTANTTLGTISLDAGQILDPNVTTYTWTFEPSDDNFYIYYEGNAENGNVIKGTIELEVLKREAEIVITENLVQTESNRKTLIALINGLSQEEYDNITVEYLGADGTRYAQMPKDAGQYTVVVTYGGDEHYAETVWTTTLTIKEEDNFDWLIYVGIGLLTLALASTVFFLFRRKA